MGFTLPEEKTRVPPNAQNENFTLSLMGFTIPEEKTPVPPNAGNEIQSCVGMLNCISWGESL